MRFPVLTILWLVSSIVSYTTALPTLTSGEFDNVGLSKRDSSSSCCSIVNGCPNLDFSWRTNQQGIMPYYLNITSVKWIQSNLYNMTIRVQGDKTIPLNTLWGLKIINIQGPVSTMVLYGINEKIYSITNPTDYTVTLQVYANVDSSNRVWMPNFQFHYEYCQGTVAQNCNNWAWGTKTFDMNTGCNN